MTHRVTSNSKRGRQLLSQNKRLLPADAAPALTQEQIDWNAEVEHKRQLKKEAKRK